MKRATQLIVEALREARPAIADREALDQWKETRRAFVARLKESKNFDKNAFYIETNR